MARCDIIEGVIVYALLMGLYQYGLSVGITYLSRHVCTCVFLSNQQSALYLDPHPD